LPSRSEFVDGPGQHPRRLGTAVCAHEHAAENASDPHAGRGLEPTGQSFGEMVDCGARRGADPAGVARPYGAACDIGAYEYVPQSSPPPPPPPPPPSPPTNTVPPKVTGTPLRGDPLNCSTGTWTGNPTTYAYRWNRTGSAITGATTNHYTVQVKDEAQTLSCTVTATNPGGTTSATSPPVLVAQPGTLHCPKPFGHLAGTQLGPFKLGKTRQKARTLLKHWHLAPYGLDAGASASATPQTPCSET
jgi:hypothetical protein